MNEFQTKAVALVKKVAKGCSVEVYADGKGIQIKTPRGEVLKFSKWEPLIITSKLRKSLGLKPGKRKPKANPSPGVLIHGEHASAEDRIAAAKAFKKALAWYQRKDLVKPARVLKGFTFPRSFVEIGTLEAIRYGSIKFDGVDRSYLHEVTQKRRLFISTDGSTFVCWPPLTVTARGIMG